MAGCPRSHPRIQGQFVVALPTLDSEQLHDAAEPGFGTQERMAEVVDSTTWLIDTP
jgi:hypothetical protein